MKTSVQILEEQVNLWLAIQPATPEGERDKAQQIAELRRSIQRLSKEPARFETHLPAAGRGTRPQSPRPLGDRPADDPAPLPQSRSASGILGEMPAPAYVRLSKSIVMLDGLTSAEGSTAADDFSLLNIWYGCTMRQIHGNKADLDTLAFMLSALTDRRLEAPPAADLGCGHEDRTTNPDGSVICDQCGEDLTADVLLATPQKPPPNSAVAAVTREVRS